MEAHRATDNVQQKASDCLGTENEWVFDPVFLGPRPKNLVWPNSFLDDPEYMMKIREQAYK